MVEEVGCLIDRFLPITSYCSKCKFNGLFADFLCDTLGARVQQLVRVAAELGVTLYVRTPEAVDAARREGRTPVEHALAEALRPIARVEILTAEATPAQQRADELARGDLSREPPPPSP